MLPVSKTVRIEWVTELEDDYATEDMHIIPDAELLGET